MIFRKVGLTVVLAIAFGSGVYILASQRQTNDRPAMDGEQIADGSPVAAISSNAPAEELPEEFVPWNRFRGPNGSGHSDDKQIPSEWSDNKNLSWKLKLPGFGSSSPILTKSYVFVTCYSGYGVPGERGGSSDDLFRYLCCIDRKTGKEVWKKEFPNDVREDGYQGNGLPEHGYATNTPVTDGKSVFAFFGKSGVFAFDLKGKQLWKKSVGTDSANRRWGSAASLLLYKNLVIVNAAEEGRAIVAFDKDSGEEVWKAEADSLELCYSTPVIASSKSRDELVIAVPGEVWGMNPNNGKLFWYAETPLTGNLSPSINLAGDNAYVFGGYRSSGSVSIQLGGKGDVTKSHVKWSQRNSSYVATPILLKDRMYWIDDKGTFYCVNTKDGELVHRERLRLGSSNRPVYASGIAIDGKLLFQTRYGGVVVVSPSDELNIVSTNRFESDESQFNATPAVGSGQLFLRSDTHLYCVTKTAKK